MPASWSTGAPLLSVIIQMTHCPRHCFTRPKLALEFIRHFRSQSAKSAKSAFSVHLDYDLGDVELEPKDSKMAGGRFKMINPAIQHREFGRRAAEEPQPLRIADPELQKILDYDPPKKTYSRRKGWNAKEHKLVREARARKWETVEPATNQAKLEREAVAQESETANPVAAVEADGFDQAPSEHLQKLIRELETSINTGEPLDAKWMSIVGASAAKESKTHQSTSADNGMASLAPRSEIMSEWVRETTLGPSQALRRALPPALKKELLKAERKLRNKERTMKEKSALRGKPVSKAKLKKLGLQKTKFHKIQKQLLRTAIKKGILIPSPTKPKFFLVPDSNSSSKAVEAKEVSEKLPANTTVFQDPNSNQLPEVMEVKEVPKLLQSNSPNSEDLNSNQAPIEVEVKGSLEPSPTTTPKFEKRNSERSSKVIKAKRSMKASPTIPSKSEEPSSDQALREVEAKGSLESSPTTPPKIEEPSSDQAPVEVEAKASPELSPTTPPKSKTRNSDRSSKAMKAKGSMKTSPTIPSKFEEPSSDQAPVEVEAKASPELSPTTPPKSETRNSDRSSKAMKAKGSKKTSPTIPSKFEEPDSDQFPKTVEVKGAKTMRSAADFPPKPREPWQIQKEALLKKFGEEGWNPRKKLSPDTLEGIRALHEQYPERFTTPTLAKEFKISPEAIRRILKSKWRPDAEKIAERRERWVKRHDRIWDQQAELGLRPARTKSKKLEDLTDPTEDANKADLLLKEARYST